MPIPPQDKETLEDAVRKQHDLIEKQNDELKALKRQLEERDGEVSKHKWVAMGGYTYFVNVRMR